MAELWAPALSDVGARVPTKTRPVDAVGDVAPLGTFDETTMPTAEMVQPILDNAITSIARSISAAIPANVLDLAKDAAAWRAAADVELAWPERNADITQVYDRLDARAKLALERLIEACDDAGAGTDATLPVWEMPAPVPWGDDHL
jgi:hypothetical protein